MDSGADAYRRFLAGEDGAIGEIVVSYRDGLMLYLNGYVHNLAVAEELTEDAFFRLMVRKPPFFHRYTFKTWLYTIGRNLTVDYLRHQARGKTEALDNLAAETENLEQRYFREERKLAVHRAMSKLKTEYREALHLTYFEGLTNDQAGKVMGKNKSQLEMLLYRGKLRLKAELEKEGFVYEEL